jgi:hypothetical protein
MELVIVEFCSTGLRAMVYGCILFYSTLRRQLCAASSLEVNLYDIAKAKRVGESYSMHQVKNRK